MIMHDDFYQIYLEEIEAIPVCDKEETKTLAERLESRDIPAQSRLIEGKLKAVLAIAKEYADRGVFMNDLVQEANMALTLYVQQFCAAAKTFDAGLEAAVRKALDQAVAEQHQEKEIKEIMAARVNVLQDISKMMAEELGREATLAELAEKMKMTEDEIKDIMQLTISALSVSVEPGE